MFNKNNRIMITVVSLLGFVALMLGFFVSQHVSLNKGIDVSQFHGTVLEKPRKVHAFALTGTDHIPFNNASLQGHWTMVFFGFTNCSSLCPTTLAKLGNMYRLLEANQVRPLPQVVMISLDPERDSLDKLDHYVKAFDRRFYGAQGDEASVNKLTKEIGIAYTKIAINGNENLEK